MEFYPYKVDVIVPVYNTAKYLDEFFQSLMNQTFQDFQVTVVDDCSTDNSLEVVNKYAERYKGKVNVLQCSKNLGLPSARDFALDNGSILGEYTLFLDSDDYIELEYLKIMIYNADSTQADITICGYRCFDDATRNTCVVGMINNPTDVLTDIYNQDIYAYMALNVWTKLFRRKSFIEFRFNSFRNCEDVRWMVQILPNIRKAKFVNEVLYHYRIRSDSTTNTMRSKSDYYNFVEGFRLIYEICNSNTELYSPYLPLIELIVFKSFAIRIPSIVSQGDIKLMIELSNSARNFMDTYFIGWRNNKFLKFPICKNRGFKGILFWFCSILYKLNIFPLFLLLYSLIIKLSKKDLRW